MTGLNIADLAIRASKLQNISNIPVNCCIECGLFPRSLMESTIAGAGFAGERRTLGSNDDYFLYLICKFNKNLCFFFMILPSKFAFWVNLNPTLWVATGARGVNPSKWQLRVASGPI